ncbi:unnamed protein product [Cutaneotrichosporon oleaginosum]
MDSTASKATESSPPIDTGSEGEPRQGAQLNALPGRQLVALQHSDSITRSVVVHLIPLPLTACTSTGRRWSCYATVLGVGASEAKTSGLAN